MSASMLVGVNTASPAQAAVSACPGGASAFPHELTGGGVFDSSGQLVAQFETHTDGQGRFCVMLQASKWRGTPHYMSVRLCRTKGNVDTCGPADAGNFSYYAGPVVRDFGNADHCYCARVVVKRPDGTKVRSGFNSIVGN